MPWISGIVGWGTNVVALEMTFQPLEFFGIELVRFKNQPFGLFGWQGIIPSRVEKMASITFDLITTKLLDIQETFNKLEPEKFADAMEEGILLMLDSIISEVAMEYMPKAWAQLPKNVKDEIVIMAERDSTEFLATVMRELQTHIFDVIDMKRMVINACKKKQSFGQFGVSRMRRQGICFHSAVWVLFRFCVWLFSNGSMAFLRSELDSTGCRFPGGIHYKFFGTQGHLSTLGANRNLWCSIARTLFAAAKRSGIHLCAHHVCGVFPRQGPVDRNIDWAIV